MVAGDTPVLVHNCQFSDRATEIWNSEPDEFIKQNVSTIAVVRAQTEMGSVDLIAGSGEGLTPAQLTYWEKTKLSGEMLVPNLPGTGAEQNAFLYMKAQGSDLIGGGASRPVCLGICKPWVTMFGGAMRGPIVPYTNGKTTTRQLSFEYWGGP